MRMKIYSFLIIFFSLSANPSNLLEDEAVELLQAYLKVDTISPPGNESRAVDFLAEIDRRRNKNFANTFPVYNFLIQK